MNMFLLVMLLAVGAANDIKFALVNASTYTLTHVWITKHGSDKWGEDLLNNYPLPAGKLVTLAMTNNQGVMNWDLRVQFTDSKHVKRLQTFSSLPLPTIKKITIHIEPDGRWNSEFETRRRDSNPRLTVLQTAAFGRLATPCHSLVVNLTFSLRPRDIRAGITISLLHRSQQRPSKGSALLP
jgi:hypothetical protein